MHRRRSFKGTYVQDVFTLGVDAFMQVMRGVVAAFPYQVRKVLTGGYVAATDNGSTR